ncbi:hypothetical protein EV424DRAFT_1558582 [Suillus variegatus]|nr:hypothetical protein EV424DRAFT_1558582 [Suillus variegatus]
MTNLDRSSIVYSHHRYRFYSFHGLICTSVLSKFAMPVLFVRHSEVDVLIVIIAAGPGKCESD